MLFFGRLFACFCNVVMYVRKKFETIRKCCSSRDVESTSATEVPSRKVESTPATEVSSRKVESTEAASAKVETPAELPPMWFAPRYGFDPVKRAVTFMRFEMLASALADRTLSVSFNEYEVAYLNRTQGLCEDGEPKPKKATPNANLDVIPQATKKRKNNQKKNNRKKNNRNNHLPPEIKNNKSLMKYWHDRYSLFSKFDEGIQMDEGKRINFETRSRRGHGNAILKVAFGCRELVFGDARKCGQAYCRHLHVRNDRGRILRRWREYDSVCVQMQTRCVLGDNCYM